MMIMALALVAGAYFNTAFAAKKDKKRKKAKVELKGLALYGHVAQKEPEAVKSAVAKWLKQLGK